MQGVVHRAFTTATQGEMLVTEIFGAIIGLIVLATVVDDVLYRIKRYKRARAFARKEAE